MICAKLNLGLDI